MTRRNLISLLGAAAVAAPAERRNVLFIAIDDLNDWVGCLGGHPQTKTPNIDRVAARGVLFTRAYCAAPVCNPSRASLMTGIAPAASGVYENQQPMRQSAVLKDAITMPQHFMAHGYRVIGGGKIYHGGFPDPQSWHEYYPDQVKNKPPDPQPATRPANGIPGSGNMDWGPLDLPDSAMGDFKVVDWAASELRRKQDKPLFLACGIYKPHLPWHVPRKYFDLHPLDSLTLPIAKEDDLDDVPPVGRRLALRSGDHKRITSADGWKKAVQAYLAAISFADAQVGRVLDALESGPNAGKTAVVLWSDHGWHLGEKLHWRKFALWEEATRNVLAIAAPGVTKAGTKCHRTVNSLDLYPTLNELCGLSRKSGLEGASLLPLLRNPAAKWERASVSTYERGNHSVRSERWRYIRYHDGTEELYDHDRDELEHTNLAGRAELAGVKRELSKWLPKVDAPDSPKGKGVEEGY